MSLHLHVSVLHCDSVATLEETLLHLAALDLHLVRLGAASVGFPATEFHAVRRALEAQSCYPRIVGLPKPELEHEESTS